MLPIPNIAANAGLICEGSEAAVIGGTPRNVAAIPIAMANKIMHRTPSQKPARPIRPSNDQSNDIAFSFAHPRSPITRFCAYVAKFTAPPAARAELGPRIANCSVGGTQAEALRELQGAITAWRKAAAKLNAH